MNNLGWLGLGLGVIAACGGKAVIDPEIEDTLPIGGSAPASSSPSSSSAGGTGGMGGQEGGAPPIPPLVQEKLGSVPIGSEATFGVPPNTLGFTLVARASNNFTLLGFQRLAAPNGAVLVQDFGIVGTEQHYEWYGSSVLAVPQTDDPEAMPLMPGIWTLTLGSSDNAPAAEVSVWRRQTLDGKFHGGRIDVNVFIAQGAPATPQSMDATLKEAFDGYAGLQLGTVTHHSLGPEYSVIDNGNALEVFWQTEGAPGKPAINVIVVAMIDSPGVGGFSPGAPALALEHGTSQSGVVVLPFDQLVDWMVLAHEAGHFSGLMHTSEFTGLADRLSDTPSCTTVELDPQSCADRDNLMFPYGSLSIQRLLTPQQETVLQASALYRGAVEPGGGFPEPLDANDDFDGAALAGPHAHPHLGAGAARAATAALRSGPWAKAIDPTLATVLGGHWCTSGPVAHDHLGQLRALASDGELLAIGADGSAPEYVRMRALAALGRGKLTASQLAELESLARAGDVPRLARYGAIAALREQSPLRVTALGVALAADADPVMRRFAERRLRAR